MPFIIIKPLKPVSFRWGGEFSPSLSGPMNKGVSEPLPLPSTIAGFVYSISKKWGTRAELQQLSLEDESVKVKLWGPLLFKEDTRGGKYYSHSYPGRLIELDNWELKVEEGKVREVSVNEVLKVVNKIGIGMKFNSKSVAEEMLYTQQLVKITDGGIVVEVEEEIKDGYYTMGGEGSIVKVEHFNLTPPGSGDYGLVISPVILPPKDRVVSVDDFYDVEIKGCGKLGDNLVEGLPVKIGLIGLGFNVAYNVRRPIYPAIIPGSVLKCNKRGNVGEFSNSWGSILPVRVRREA